MSGGPFGLRVTRDLARVLLRCYPRRFRQRWGDEFIQAAAHRWQRERETARLGAIGTLRAGLLLCADTLGAAPGTWRSTPGWGGSPDGFDPHHRRRDRIVFAIAGTLADLRMAVRLLRRQAGTSLLAVATLALGIGVSTAAFAALDRVVLNPLPFAHGQRMRYLARQHKTLGWRITPDADTLARWRTATQSIARIETYRDTNAIRLDTGQPERLNVLMVSTGLPGMLGVRPVAGRMLVESDAAPNAPAAVMVHEGFWRQKLGADPAIVGRDFRFTSGPATVVGIWPASARVNQRVTADLIRMMPGDQEIRPGGWTSILALLEPGADDAAAAAELNSLAVITEARANEYQFVVLPPTGFVNEAYLQGLWLVFAAAISLLVVAIVNAANLLLGRATTRTGELGVRLALGGSPARILRLFAAESVAITAIGVAGGVVVAWLTTKVYGVWQPAGMGAVRQGWFDARTAVFVGGAAALAAIAAALIPAWRARSSSVREVLTDGARTTDAASSLRAGLVGVQAALAALLVAGASITGRSFHQLASVNPGFDVDPLAMVSVAASPLRFPTPEVQENFLRQVRESIAALPQVERMTVTNAPPFATSTVAAVPVLEGEPEPSGPPAHETRSQSVDAEYFAVFGTPIVAGRMFEPADGLNVVIVNESFARVHGGNVVGRRLKLTGRNERWYTIVGIAGDVTAGTLVGGAQSDPQLYFPQAPRGEQQFVRFMVRVNGDPETLINEVRTRVAALDPTTTLAEARTGRQIFDAQTERHRFVAYLLGGLALFGIVFAVSGIYGIVSLDVTRRRREVGVRVALGATPANVVAHMIRRGLRPVLIGAALGVLGGLWLGPLLKDLLFRVSERDPLSAFAGLGLVVLTAAAGCAVPARRAARVDPVIALRAD
jgi:putative ABC transport system permease protein